VVCVSRCLAFARFPRASDSILGAILKEATLTGRWVVVQHCDMAPPHWMRDLEQAVRYTCASIVHARSYPQPPPRCACVCGVCDFTRYIAHLPTSLPHATSAQPGESQVIRSKQVQRAKLSAALGPWFYPDTQQDPATTGQFPSVLPMPASDSELSSADDSDGTPHARSRSRSQARATRRKQPPKPEPPAVRVTAHAPVAVAHNFRLWILSPPGQFLTPSLCHMCDIRHVSSLLHHDEDDVA